MRFILGDFNWPKELMCFFIFNLYFVICVSVWHVWLVCLSVCPQQVIRVPKLSLCPRKGAQTNKPTQATLPFLAGLMGINYLTNVFRVGSTQLKPIWTHSRRKRERERERIEIPSSVKYAIGGCSLWSINKYLGN